MIHMAGWGNGKQAGLEHLGRPMRPGRWVL